MRSHLTRHVFRHLLSNEPIPHCSCLLQVTSSTLALRRPFRRRHTPCLLLASSQRRSIGGGFANFFRSMRERNSPDPETKGNMEPGCAQLEDFARRQNISVRLPSEEAMVKAWTAYCHHKRKTVGEVTLDQATQLDLVLEYLKGKKSGSGEFYLPTRDLVELLLVLPRSAILQPAARFRGLAKSLFNEIWKRRDVEQLQKADLDSWLTHVSFILAVTGNLDEAKQTCQSLEGDSRNKAWERILKASMHLGNESHIQNTIKEMNSKNIPLSFHSFQFLCVHYARSDQFDKAKEFFQEANRLRGDDPLTIKLYVSMVRSCIRAKDLSWGQDFVNSLVQDFPASPVIWAPVFIWTLGTQKSVDEVGRMVDVMEKRSDVRLNISMIDQLVDFAMSEKDPYLAERIITMGKNRSVQPNWTTYLKQIKYRLAAGDLKGAMSAYNDLVGDETTQKRRNLSPIDKLIQSMCRSLEYDYDAIMDVVEYRCRLQRSLLPETVAALSQIHLKREEYRQVISLLQENVYNYSSNDRQLVRNVFESFCLNRNNTIAEVWDCYQILINIFHDLPHEVCTQLMKEFFARRRPDMAVHAFNHMRAAISPKVRATRETYIEAFIGCAATMDREVLYTVHNQLKIDAMIQPSTRLSNALMLAYAHCRLPGYALSVWRKILNSDEGPSFESIHIALRACEYYPLGTAHAEDIWATFTKLEIDIDRDLLASYVGALAGNYEFDKTVDFLASIKGTYGIDPDVVILGSFYNATGGIGKQQEVQGWIQENYPAIWKEMESIGIRRKTREGHMMVNIDRTLKP